MVEPSSRGACPLCEDLQRSIKARNDRKATYATTDYALGAVARVVCHRRGLTGSATSTNYSKRWLDHHAPNGEPIEATA